MKKLKIVLASIALAFASVASAALLTTYVTSTGDATIDQAVVFTTSPETSHSYTYSGIAGDVAPEENDEIQNRSQQTAPVNFVTSYSPDGDGIDTSYWSTLILENKNISTWALLDSDGIKATLTYELESDDFNYEFEAVGEGLLLETSYSLIYYADKQNRFVDGGGDNPGALIATFMTDVEGNIPFVKDSINLMMNLPHADDWNGTSDANYCGNADGTPNADGDNYDLCRGAKIWLIPTANYDGVKVSSWANMGSFLYETDLITYDDTDTDTISLNMFTGKLSFIIRNIFDIALVPNTYTITTSVNPAL